MGDGLFVHGGVTDAQEARLALAGLFAVQGATLLDARTGVMHGAGSTALVTGTAATAPMTVSIAPHNWVTSRGTSNGPYLGALAAAQSVTIGAAPGSGTRIDVVYVKQNDPTPGVPTPDTSPATAQPIYGVLAGIVGAGKPGPLPVGAEELATVAVSAGATKTTDGTVLITNTARQTVARGADIPVSGVTERDAITKFVGLAVKRLDAGGRVERWDGSAWTVGGPRFYSAGTNSSTSLTAAPTGPAGGAALSLPAGTFDIDLRAYFALSVGTANTDIFMGVYNGTTQLFATDFNVQTVGGAASRAHADFTRLTLASPATLTLKFWTGTVGGTQAVSSNALRAVQVS